MLLYDDSTFMDIIAVIMKINGSLDIQCRLNISSRMCHPCSKLNMMKLTISNMAIKSSMYTVATRPVQPCTPCNSLTSDFCLAVQPWPISSPIFSRKFQILEMLTVEIQERDPHVHNLVKETTDHRNTSEDVNKLRKMLVDMINAKWKLCNKATHRLVSFYSGHVDPRSKPIQFN